MASPVQTQTQTQTQANQHETWVGVQRPYLSSTSPPDSDIAFYIDVYPNAEPWNNIASFNLAHSSQPPESSNGAGDLVIQDASDNDSISLPGPHAIGSYTALNGSVGSNMVNSGFIDDETEYDNHNSHNSTSSTFSDRDQAEMQSQHDDDILSVPEEAI